MKTRIISGIVVIAAAVIFFSCQNDDGIAKPVITIHELGDGESHGNDHTAKIGGELHIEADVLAEGKIANIQVRVHPEGEHHDGGGHEEWEIDTTYTKFAGLKNTLFHEHLDIDTLAEPGDYHFDFTVTDMEGNQSSAESDLQIVE